MNTLTQPKKMNWRERAISDALHAEAMDGYGYFALVNAVRRHRPLAATIVAWADRLRLISFLETHATGFRTLIEGHHGHIERTQTFPFLGWYAAEWEGQTIEVALKPSTGVSDTVIIIGDDEAHVRRFADALEEFEIRPPGRCLLYSEEWRGAPELDAEIGKVTWDDVVLPPETLTGLREAVDGFVTQRETFEAMGFPWRRGVLLVGPPGTGKTMICKAAAAALPDLPFLYVRTLAKSGSCRKDTIREVFERARKVAPCLLAFEDIDGLVDKDNRSIFLNEIDGFRNNNGVLIIASSNHPEKLDEALLKRPSRFDRVFHVGLPGPGERAEFCRRLLTRWKEQGRFVVTVDIELLARDVSERSERFTPAYLKEAFVAAALQHAQAGRRELDDRYAEAVLTQIDELRTHLRRVKDPEGLGVFDTIDQTVGFRR